MKTAPIRFFSPLENSERKEKSAAKSVTITGYISSTGKLVFPAKTIGQLGFDPEATQFKIGTQGGIRKLKSLYLIPTTDEASETFDMIKAAKSYGIPLAVILQKGGVDYANAKYTFTVKPFDYEDDMKGYELLLNDQTPKPAYTGKPRGRKPKAQVISE